MVTNAELLALAKNARDESEIDLLAISVARPADSLWCYWYVN